jgi:hypothetical protein
MSADDGSYSMTVPSASLLASDAKVLIHPALRRRSALRERRPQAVRRHTRRVTTRFAVLVIGDVIAILRVPPADRDRFAARTSYLARQASLNS